MKLKDLLKNQQNAQKIDIININIRFLLTRLITDSNQPKSISKTQKKIAKTYIIYIKPDLDSITQIIPQALIREILKN